MSNSLTVLSSKGLCTIQDLGRPHTQHLGFSVGGAADEYAFLSANRLLNNEFHCAALEVTLGQLTLLANCPCTIVITGADCNASLNGKNIKHWQVHELLAGDILHLGQPKQGLHSYIAVTNGLSSHLWLGSRAQTINEQTLGFNGECITQGDTIKLAKNCQQVTPSSYPPYSRCKALLTSNKFYQGDNLVLRFIPNRLWESLSFSAQQAFCRTDYMISADSNRMGYRLHSQLTPALFNQQCAEMTPLTTLSKPVTYGAIQLPQNNQPIVLMKERQTIGGYPLLGTVMQTDLFRLSQKRPGQTVTFLPISLIQAQQQLLAFYHRFS